MRALLLDRAAEVMVSTTMSRGGAGKMRMTPTCCLVEVLSQGLKGTQQVV